MEEIKHVPETDEDAREIISRDNQSASGDAQFGIYMVFRKKGESVMDAWIHMLNHVIGVYEGMR